jgi:hypothetical protein
MIVHAFISHSDSRYQSVFSMAFDAVNTDPVYPDIEMKGKCLMEDMVT